VIAMLLFLAFCFGCTPADRQDNGKASIVCTIFPQYDWVREILGDRAGDVELTLLAKNSADLHNYQPSVDDIVKISTCDLFIYVGGESDKWVENALRSASNREMTVIRLIHELGAAAKTEEITEGMQEEDDTDDDESGYDEHVWLSLRNAQIFCRTITEALSSLNADYAEEYRRNMSVYIEKLTALDLAYQAAVDAAPVHTLLFGDRFPFRYLVDDYGLPYFAAFPGCSTETEATFATIIFLVNKIDELNLNYVLVTESADQSIARTIISNTADKKQRILVLDALQSVTSEEMREGKSYLSVMESNLAVLKEALGY
jgi:zinc transport system substrate-binding protein